MILRVTLNHSFHNTLLFKCEAGRVPANQTVNYAVSFSTYSEDKVSPSP